MATGASRQAGSSSKPSSDGPAGPGRQQPAFGGRRPDIVRHPGRLRQRRAGRPQDDARRQEAPPKPDGLSQAVADDGASDSNGARRSGARAGRGITSVQPGVPWMGGPEVDSR